MDAQMDVVVWFGGDGIDFVSLSFFICFLSFSSNFLTVAHLPIGLALDCELGLDSQESKLLRLVGEK
jgi:hypothetical protein